MNFQDDSIKIVEIFHDPENPIKIFYRYVTSHHFEIVSEVGVKGWKFDLRLKALDRQIEKTSESVLFMPFVEKARVFKATFEGAEVGYLQIGHETWNNRVRVWDLLVQSGERRMGVGSKLMMLAILEAKKLGARAIVLETQSCNVPAINFYLKHKFDLIGFDAIHYSNEDLERKEFRMEFGMLLT